MLIPNNEIFDFHNPPRSCALTLFVSPTKNVSATVDTSKFVREINLPIFVEFSVKYVLDCVFCLSKHSILLESTTFQYMHEFSSRKYSNVKLEKFKRGRPPSLHLAKEGDFA